MAASIYTEARGWYVWASDDFNRTDENPITGWTKPTEAAMGCTDCKVVSNQVEAAGATFSIVYKNGTFHADQASEIVETVASPTFAAAPCVRLQSNGGYIISAHNPTAWYLYKYTTAGGWKDISTGVPSATAIITGVHGIDMVGTTLIMRAADYTNLMQATDSSWSGGSPGICMEASGATDPIGDDWYGCCDEAVSSGAIPQMFPWGGIMNGVMMGVSHAN
jgi:hypothetical protein